MGDLEREEFYRALDGLTTAIHTGNEHIQKQLSGLADTQIVHGQAIAAIQAVMEERDKQEAKDMTARWTALGSILASIATGIVSWWGGHK